MKTIKGKMVRNLIRWSSTFISIVICSFTARAQSQESKSNFQIYSQTGSADTLDKGGTVAQQLKLTDERTYELTSKVLTPSINGGNHIEREVTETSRPINAN